VKIFFIVVSILATLYAFASHALYPNDLKKREADRVLFLDSVILKERKVDGLKFCEISDMAYVGEGELYMLSDKGKIFKAKIKIRDQKIKDFKLISAKKLKDIGGKKLLKPYRDSEGMAVVDVRDKKRFLISFERKPRIYSYDESFDSPTPLTLPKSLRDIYRYRGKNRALEALGYSKRYGYITTSELPLRGESRKYHTIYSHKGEICKIKKDDKKNSIVEFETIDDDTILALFRRFDMKHLSFKTTLKKIHLDKIKNGICQTESLAVLKSSEGWDIDNFEGLAKVGENLYLMISDDNQNPFEKTILTLFRLKEQKR
jgi:hypothetical protein